MTLFSSTKPIFRQPRSFKFLVTLPSVRIKHSADRALFFQPLSPTIPWPLLHSHQKHSYWFLHEDLFSWHPSKLPWHFYPWRLQCSLPNLGQSHPPNPPGNDLFRWITSSGLKILNDPTSPTLLHHSTENRSSPDISLAPASLAPHCKWRTLPGLGSDHLPIEIVLPLSPVCHPNTHPPRFKYKKARWDVYQSYINEHLPSLNVDAVNIYQTARSFPLFLVEAAKASIPLGCLGRSPIAWWSQEAESAVRERRKAGSEAHRSEAHRLRYIDVSRRASSVISRTKSATWQANYSNLSPHSDLRAVFKLLNAISGRKNTSQDPSFPGCSSPLDTANHYASYLRSHLSQATPRTSRRAERQFMNEFRKASCEDASSLHNSFCSPFSLAELSTAISKLSSFTASGPEQIAYPSLKLLPEPAQLLFFLFSIGPGPLTLSPLVGNLPLSFPFTNLESPLSLCPPSAPFLSPLASPSFLSAWFFLA